MNSTERKNLANERGVNDVYYNPEAIHPHGKCHIGETNDGPIYLRDDYKLSKKTEAERRVLREKTIKTVDYTPDPDSVPSFRYKGVLIKKTYDGLFKASIEAGCISSKTSLGALYFEIDKIMDGRKDFKVLNEAEAVKEETKQIIREVGHVHRHNAQREFEIVEGENGQEALVRFKSDGTESTVRIADIEYMSDGELVSKSLGLLNPNANSDF